MSDRPPQSPYSVVVGVSARSKSPAALRWAAAQAARNDGRLIAVRAWRMPSSPGTTSGVIAARAQGSSERERVARRALEADVAEALGPDHRAEVRLVRGGDRRVLLEQAKGADLLVIDAPRRLRGEPLFSERIIGAATCPVLVMPPGSRSSPAAHSCPGPGSPLPGPWRARIVPHGEIAAVRPLTGTSIGC